MIKSKSSLRHEEEILRIESILIWNQRVIRNHVLYVNVSKKCKNITQKFTLEVYPTEASNFSLDIV